MTLLNYIEVFFQVCILLAIIGIIVVLILRITNRRFPRKWVYWPWHLLNDLADRPPDVMERVFRKIQAIRVRW